MKLQLFYLLLILLAVTATAPAQFSFPSYKEAMTAGKIAYEGKKYDDAIAAYKSAEALAKTDPERADALIAKGDAYQKATRKVTTGSGKFAVTKDVMGDPDSALAAYTAASTLPSIPPAPKIRTHFSAAAIYAVKVGYGEQQRAELDKILALPQATADDKFDAYFQRGRSSYAIFTSAYLRQREDLKKAVAVDGVSDEKKAEALKVLAESHSNNTEALQALKFYDDIIRLQKAATNQKLNAYLKMANYYGSQNDFNQVRAITHAMSLLPGIKPEQKADALQMTAQSYFLQNNLPAGEAEIAKIDTIKDIEAKNWPAIYQENGDLLARYRSHGKARFQYEKALKSITDNKSYVVGDLTNKVIKTWFDEKNYKKTHEAVKRFIAMPDADDYRKQAALLTDAEAYLAEAKYSDAAGVYTTVLADPKLSIFRNIKVLFGMARAQYGLKNLPEAKKYYASALSAVEKQEKIFDPRQMKMSPAEIGEFKRFAPEYTKEAKTKIAEIDGKAASQ